MGCGLRCRYSLCRYVYRRDGLSDLIYFMLKKLLVFALWSILLCLLLVICLIITTWQNWPAPIAFLLLLIIAIVIIALRLFGLYLFQSYHNGAITRLFGRFRLSRMEYVLFQHWKAGAAVIRRIHRRKNHYRGISLQASDAERVRCWQVLGCPCFPMNRKIYW